MPIEPTSPAKHLALPFGRKLKTQNTSEARIVDIIKLCSTNTPFIFTNASGINTAKEYPAVMPLIPSIKFITFVAPTYTIKANNIIHHIDQYNISNW